MAQAAVHDTRGSLLLPALLLTGLLGVMGAQTGVLTFPVAGDGALAPATVTIAPRAFSYRAPGDYQQAGVSIDAPLVDVASPAPLDIMTYQVSAIDYARCVADGACEKADPRRRGQGNVPVTGVSFNDATAYAAWLSQKTGATWRLPTVEEWVFAAGSKAGDNALGRATEAGNPADRWLAFYEKESALGANALATPEGLGFYGMNEFGVADLAETVWEWTATCGGRTTLDAAGGVASTLDSCGVRLLEGRHRTPMSGFVRDALGGGCSTGVPPDNLGFRLVRERSLVDRVAAFFGIGR